MGNTTIALVFVMFVNVLLFLNQATVNELNPSGALVYWHDNGTLLEEFKDKDLLSTDTARTYLPSSGADVEATTGNFFTDIFDSVKGWWQSLGKGVTYFMNILTAPYNLLKSLNLPPTFVYAIGTLWYGITLFLLISFIWGRE